MLDIVLVFVLVLLSVWWWSTRRQTGLPPSPGIALPLIGHLHLMEPDPTRLFKEWRKRLGDVYTLMYGPHRVVMVNGYKALHEALVKQHEVFMNRADSFLHTMLFNNRGVISLADDEWKEQRAFLQTTLKSLGMGRNVMADNVATEIGFLLDAFRETRGQPTNFRMLLSASVSNVISLVTFGRRFDYTDPEFLHMQALTVRAFELVPPSSPLHFFFRLIKYSPVDLFHYRELQNYIQSMRSIFQKMINESNNAHDSGDDSKTCVIEYYIDEIKRKTEAGETMTSINSENLLYSAWNLFNAGTDTTSTTLLFAILYMTVYQDVQEKLYEEIKTIVGTEKLPDMSHKAQLKYVNAFILETQRFTSLIPLSLDRLTRNDTKLLGYSIPKGTVILPVLDSVMWDDDVWGDPMTFRPERFLKNGVLTVKKEFLPFSIGRRSCLGESLAVTELYLFTTAFVQTFQFLPEDPSHPPSVVGRHGFTRVPEPFNVRAVPRQR
ncbi:cytochrome P450 2J6-like [Physella acuta]|uniref:cytochrome P450 2J6-like n=1 Tax=Physella acuta TaxID=109671 RepID=UPI0027DD19A2|nr:cytochrome P450 2J6-like [Physella acuta]